MALTTITHLGGLTLYILHHSIDASERGCRSFTRCIQVTSLVTPCAEDGFFGRLEVDINRFIHNFQPLAHNDFQLLSSVI